MNAALVPAVRPSIYFIGVTTGQSSIMKVFPRWADVLATAPAAELLLSDWTDAGRVRLHTAPLPLAQLTPPQEKTKEIRDTVSSLRLDAVLAAMLRCSRGMAAELVTAGRVEINHLPAESVSSVFTERVE